jgi:hypothetical protein
MTIPMSVRYMSRSNSVLMITGSAEIAIAVPKNSMKISGSASGVLPSSCGTSHAAPAPSANGTMTLAIPTLSATSP